MDVDGESGVRVVRCLWQWDLGWFDIVADA